MADIFFLQGVSGFKRMLNQEIDSINHAYDHSDQQVCHKDGDDGDDEGEKLFASLTVYSQNHFWFCKVVARANQDDGQYTIGDEIEEGNGKEHGQQ